jgi:hypothetical protein
MCLRKEMFDLDLLKLKIFTFKLLIIICSLSLISCSFKPRRVRFVRSIVKFDSIHE